MSAVQAIRAPEEIVGQIRETLDYVFIHSPQPIYPQLSRVYPLLDDLMAALLRQRLSSVPSTSVVLQSGLEDDALSFEDKAELLRCGGEEAI